MRGRAEYIRAGTAAAWAAIWAIGAGQAQPPGAPVFDVASVRVSRFAQAGGEGSRREKIEYSPLSLTMRNVSLATALKWAWGLREFQIAGPEWRFSERYDISARTGRPAPAERLKFMLRQLLTERFRIVSHREAREMPVYELVAGKGGPKLHPSIGEGEPTMTIEGGSFVFSHTSMAGFADDLTSLRALEGRPVFDRTGIPGVFDFRLRLGDSGEEMRKALAESDGASVFETIRRELGLRLAARKGQVEVLVIDQAERTPLAN